MTTNETVVVTDQMKRAGSEVLFKALGCQHSPDDITLEQLAELVLVAMLDATAEESIRTVARGNEWHD